MMSSWSMRLAHGCGSSSHAPTYSAWSSHTIFTRVLRAGAACVGEVQRPLCTSTGGVVRLPRVVVGLPIRVAVEHKCPKHRPHTATRQTVLHAISCEPRPGQQDKGFAPM